LGGLNKMTENEKLIIEYIQKEYGNLNAKKSDDLLNIIANIIAYWRFMRTNEQLELIMSKIYDIERL
jgi:hypothetical protein